MTGPEENTAQASKDTGLADDRGFALLFSGATALWRSQVQTLEDLTKFVTAHGPKSETPLAALPWQIDKYAVFAKLDRPVPEYADPEGTLADFPAVVAAYAAVLGSEVKTHRAKDFDRTGTEYFTHGRIGVPEGSEKTPRTKVSIFAVVWDQEDNDA